MKKYIFFLLIFIAIGSRAQNLAELNFRATLEKHLSAIAEKNLSVVEATVADSITLIFPDGEILKSKQKFVTFHEKWFKDPYWKMTTEIMQVHEAEKFAYGLVKYKLMKYNTDGGMKSESNTYLLLVFQKQKEGWKLLHDQNTKITM